MSIKPTQNYALLVSFRTFVGQLVQYAKVMNAEGVITISEHDWEGFITRLFVLILNNMNMTTNV